MASRPVDHLRALLDSHDGDDRCRCLRRCVMHLVERPGDADVVDEVIETMTHCLASHPAGLTVRGRFD